MTISKRTLIYTIITISVTIGLQIVLSKHNNKAKLVSEVTKMLESDMQEQSTDLAEPENLAAPILLNVQPNNQLSTIIDKAASKHGLDRRLLSCIAFVESSYDGSKISTTMDYGLMQLNIGNVERFKLDLHRLINDVEYNADQGAKLLAHYQMHFKDDEPTTWYCRYNIGTGPLTRKGLGYRCVVYATKVQECLKASDIL